MKRVTIATLLMLTALASQQASATTYFGMFTLALTINISSATVVPQGSSILCTFSAETSGDSESPVNIETVSATATVSNSVATCNLTIPYEWNLATPNSDLVTFEYSTSIVPSGGAGSAFRNGTHALLSATGVGASGSHVSLSAETRL